jgi:hypothetical protein|tara:strand:+ start:1930 stop:2559 length:630 start_codon:yes stop_codon:yes gene_type:complete
MASRKNVMRPLHLILAILLVSVLFYLLVQVRLGYISCNLGRFSGVQGRVPWLDKDAKHLFEKIQSTEKFVDDIKSSIQNSELSSKEMYEQLHKLRGSAGQDLLAFASTTTDKHTRGDLLVRTDSNGVCNSHQPYCHTIKKRWVGENLWDLKIKDGSYEVRDWISLAEDGGGWMASYWKNHKGNIIPKYVYVVNVPTKNLILLSTAVGTS